jgi:quercetin dioxygenase-like cupin family protein
MLSTLSLLFFFPAAFMMCVPMWAIINGAYDGDQALAAVLGLVFALPGFVMVAIDLVRKGWRRSLIGLIGIAMLATPWIVTLVYGGACELLNICDPRTGATGGGPITAVRSAEVVFKNDKSSYGLQTESVFHEHSRRALYTIRSTLKKGLTFNPHANTDDRVISIVSGPLYLGAGEKVSKADQRAYGPGDLARIPAHTRHYFTAPEGDVVFDQFGRGVPDSYEPDVTD